MGIAGRPELDEYANINGLTLNIQSDKYVIQSSAKDNAGGFQINYTAPSFAYDDYPNNSSCTIEFEVPDGTRWENVIPEVRQAGQTLIAGRGYSVFGNSRLCRDINGYDFAIDKSLLENFDYDLEDKYLLLAGKRYHINETVNTSKDGVEYFAITQISPELPDSIVDRTWCTIETIDSNSYRWDYLLPEIGVDGQFLKKKAGYEFIANTKLVQNLPIPGTTDTVDLAAQIYDEAKEIDLEGCYLQIHGGGPYYLVRSAERLPDLDGYYVINIIYPDIPDNANNVSAKIYRRVEGKAVWETPFPADGMNGQVLTKDVSYNRLKASTLRYNGPGWNYDLVDTLYTYSSVTGLYITVGEDRYLITESEKNDTEHYFWIYQTEPELPYTEDVNCYIEAPVEPGVKWQNLFPEGGNEGDALVKSASGYTWAAVNTASDAQAMADAAEANAKAYADTLAQNKVDKEAGKGLSSNDFTSAEKEKLDSLSPLPEGGTSGQVLAKKKTEFSVTFNRTGHTGTNDRIVLQNLSEVPGYPNIAANSLVGYTLKGRYASGSGYVDYQDEVIGNDAQTVQDDVEILKLTMQGNDIANQKSFAPEMILNSNDDGLEWADRLEPDNILAGRNVTLDRMGRNITINCDAAGSGGSIANADTVDGYHVNDTKGGTDATTDNALWSAYKIKQFIENSAGDVPKVTLEQCNDYTIDGIFVGDFSANQNGVLNNGGKSLVFSQYSPDAPHFYNYQLIISFNGFAAYITHRHYTATDPWTVTFNKYIPYMVTSHTSSATLGTNWTGTSAPYTQTVNVNGMTSNARPLICPNYSSDNATAIAEQKAWNKIGKILVGNGTITAYCFEEKPTTAINLQIEVME